MKKYNVKRRKLINFFEYLNIYLFILLVAFLSLSSFLLVYNASSNIFLASYNTLFIILLIGIIYTAISIIRKKEYQDKPVKEILDSTEQIMNGNFDIDLTLNNSYGKYNEYDVIKYNILKMVEQLKSNALYKIDFISNLSHEIKTPLQIMKNYINLYECEKDDSKKIEYFMAINKQVDKISILVNDILKLNKLEHNNINYESSKCNLLLFIEDIISSYIDLIDEKKITLNINIEEDIIININKELISIIVSNLVTNAIKYTKDLIIINSSYIDNKLIVEVIDNGIGIKNEDGDKIFEKFYQIDNSHKSEGNGLGLALVKSVLDILGGKISVKSKINEGSSFKVEVILNG